MMFKWFLWLWLILFYYEYVSLPFDMLHVAYYIGISLMRVGVKIEMKMNDTSGPANRK